MRHARGRLAGGLHDVLALDRVLAQEMQRGVQAVGLDRNAYERMLDAQPIGFDGDGFAGGRVREHAEEQPVVAALHVFFRAAAGGQRRPATELVHAAYHAHSDAPAACGLLSLIGRLAPSGGTPQATGAGAPRLAGGGQTTLTQGGRRAGQAFLPP